MIIIIPILKIIRRFVKQIIKHIKQWENTNNLEK